MSAALPPADFAAAVARLKAAGVDNPRLDVRVLWEHAQSRGLGAAGFEALLDRRAGREPVAYLVGHKEFWGLDFAVGPGVLIPRPDTETVVEAVLARFPDRAARLRVVDLGTGSGCLLGALLHEYPAARGIGIEASGLARGFAEANLAALGLAGRGEVRAGSWLDDGLIAAGECDVVVANPPYIPTADIPGLSPDVAEYEPASALDGGPDGLSAYRALFARTEAWLSPAGTAFFEIGCGQDAALVELARASGLRVVRRQADLAGIVRVLVAERP